MHAVIQLHIYYKKVYARESYEITSTNLCPETIIETKTTLESMLRYSLDYVERPFKCNDSALHSGEWSLKCNGCNNSLFYGRIC